MKISFRRLKKWFSQCCHQLLKVYASLSDKILLFALVIEDELFFYTNFTFFSQLFDASVLFQAVGLGEVGEA
jgi:hypothetical protein